MKLLCIDTETTGLDPNTCDIIELGFALYDTDVAGQTPVFMDSFLVTPKERISDEVISVTGINQRMIDEYAIQPDEAACRLNAVIAHAPHFIVGHNIIRYDAPILRRYLELISDADAVASHPPLIDTMYDLPGLDSVEQVVIGPEVVEGKTKPLFIHGDRGQEPAKESA